LLASLAASNIKELLVTYANMSRNSTHSEYGFEINSNIKIPSSQFLASDSIYAIAYYMQLQIY